MKGVLRWFILGFFGLWLIWIMTGGPQRYENKYNQFIDTPKAPGEAGDIYNIQDLKNKTR